MWREKIGPNSQAILPVYQERPLWRRLLSRLFGPCKIVAYIGRSFISPSPFTRLHRCPKEQSGNDNRRLYLLNESWPKKVLAPSHPLTTSDPNIVNYPTMPHQHLYGDANYSFGGTGILLRWIMRQVHQVPSMSDVYCDEDGNFYRRMKQSKQPNGYLTVSAKRVRKLSHRAVLEAFIGQCPQGMEACHENGIRSDNRRVNLRWDTRKNNSADRYKHGTACLGEKHWMAKLTDADVIYVRRYCAKHGHGSMAKMAKKFNVRFGCISRIVKGQRRKNIPKG